MWMQTTRGFFSAVQHNTDPDLLVVRERVHADAVTLRDWYASWQTDMATIAQALSGTTEPVALEGPVPTITTYEWSDYPWRVILPRSAWGAFLVECVEELTYGNFKDAVKHEQGADRAQVYSKVWSALLTLEDQDPMGRRPTTWDDEPWDQYDAWEATQRDAAAWAADLNTEARNAMDDDAKAAWDYTDTDPTPGEVTAYLNEESTR